MKQVVQSIRTGQVTVVDAPAPVVQAGQVLVRVAASVISVGTERNLMSFAGKNLLNKARSRPDLVRQVVQKARREGMLAAVEAARSRLDQVVPLGYSNSGRVLAVGAEVEGIEIGDAVACAGGTYATHAEVVSVPRNLVAKVPGEGGAVSSEHAAFTTLGAVALHGVRLGNPGLGELVAVIGLGILGQITIQLLKAAGCRVIGLDLHDVRARLAKALGADVVTTDPRAMLSAVERASSGTGADVVLITADTASNEPVELAGEAARNRGAVVAVGAVGMQIPRKLYYEKELSFRVSRSYGPGRYDPHYEEKGRDYPVAYVRWTENRNMQTFLQLIADGKLELEPIITHRFPIAHAADAYSLISGKTGEAFLAVVLSYPDEPSLLHRIQVRLAEAPQVPLPAGERSPAARDLRIGLVGAGGFASSTLIPAIKKIRGAELIGVCAATAASTQHAAHKFGFRFSTTSFEELLADPDISTIVIATRHHLHARQVVAALECGKDVFCEKPLALNADELRSIAKAFEENPRSLLAVGYNRRFAPLAKRMKEFLAKCGEPLAIHYRVNAGYIPPEHWIHDPEQGGGRIAGEVCHFIDFAMFLAGSRPTCIETTALPNVGRYRNDNLVVMMRFESGSVATITYIANGDKSFGKERVEVFGGGGVAVLDDFRRLELSREGRRNVYQTRLRHDKGHVAEWLAFAAAQRSSGPPPVSFEEVQVSTVATLAAVESLRRGESISLRSE
jgi:predicted dehydrogenase